MPQEQDDPDIEIMRARKWTDMREQGGALEKAKEVEKQQQQQQNTSRDIITSYLYDRGEEVLNLAESQFPNQTRTILDRIAEFIKAGEINQRISGGELLALFRSIGINIRINTSIKIEDHGKMVSFSDKLKQENEDM